ncbi:hypothetical protein BCR37DRAFT_276906 [Protomyces lactucae-debilis]|uniref:Uncharacterized protein n=1 Tax=Protomyces lactucae-debilis TaxID=2754530 RepID=A0A1Y2FLR6_PROLT|nr:uncharacterized protein BCR37DRAFT_276906 [Protomyces lactucae-debilis]ORY83715.1 hypothetical protein BCR37DRAFT_276906 [Protomyces lactucae-debilis]
MMLHLLLIGLQLSITVASRPLKVKNFTAADNAMPLKKLEPQRVYNNEGAYYTSETFHTWLWCDYIGIMPGLPVIWSSNGRFLLCYPEDYSVNVFLPGRRRFFFANLTSELEGQHVGLYWLCHCDSMIINPQQAICRVGKLANIACPGLSLRNYRLLA